MKRYILQLIILGVSTVAFTQNDMDALRYSQHQIGGTARSVAMSGAFGALGGDFSTLSTNPAGLGVYRSSEFTFTPEFYNIKTTTRYFTTEVEETKFNFNLSNLGYVGTNLNDNSIVRAVNFGIGFNRLANFNRSSVINGDNPYTSYGDFIAGLSNDQDINLDGSLDPFSTALFYDGYVTDRDDFGYYLSQDSLNGYFNYTPSGLVFIPTEQKILREESGRINEWVFSLGMNFGDMLYAGTTLGWHTVYYDRDNTWREFRASDRNHNYFNYNENLQVRGNGFVAKFGLIFTPISAVRIGAAFHTPVYYNLTEEYTTSISTIWTNYEVYRPIDQFGNDIDKLENKYKVTTPAKFILSGGFKIGKFFILSTDLEYLDYSTMRLKPVKDFDAVNEDIRLIYSDAWNIKLGSELRLGKTYFRGGAGFYGSPFAQLEENDNAYRLSYTGGIGFREKGFFFDIAYQYTAYDQREVLYDVQFSNGEYYAPQANIDTKAHRVMTTIGFRF
jgi:hypothetical protein